jgi:hypothetical protein
MANSGKQQKMIDCMFQIVDKEQRLVAITQELKVLSKEMEKHNQEKEQVASTTLKQLVGKPQKHFSGYFDCKEGNQTRRQ